MNGKATVGPRLPAWGVERLCVTDKGVWTYEGTGQGNDFGPGCTKNQDRHCF